MEAIKEKRGLPLRWVSPKLGELTNITYGKGLPTSKFIEKGFPVFGANGIIGYYNEYLHEQEQLLISCRGANSGKINISPKYCYITNNSLIVDFPLYQKQLRKTLFYALQIADKSKLVTGTAQPQVTINNAIELKIHFPPLPEQHRIVAKIEELFSELDNGIENLKKAQEQLKTYRQAVLKYAFEGKLTKEWRTLRRRAGNPPEPAEKLLEQIKTEREKHYQKQLQDWKKTCEEAKKEVKKKPARPKKPKELPQLTEKELAELPVLPEGWVWSYFEYFGYWTGGGTPSKKEKKYWNDGNVLWISPKDMKTKYIKSTLDKITNIAVIDSSAKYIQPDSVLYVVRSGILRRILPIAITTELSTVNQDLQGFTSFPINTEYIYWYSFANEFDIRHRCAKDGTTVESIETTLLKHYRIPLPSLAEQSTIVQEIESRLSVCDKLEQTIEDSLKKAEALRQSILKKAFAGELTKDWREKHPELVTGENSAAKLLEKIKAAKALSAAGRKKPRPRKTNRK